MPDPPDLVVRWQNVPDSRSPRVLEEWSIDTDFFTSTDAFSLRYYDSDKSRLQGLELEPVELLLGDAQQLLGRIDTSAMDGQGMLELQGRDYIADLVECNIDPTYAVKKDEPLADVITGAAYPVGINTVYGDGEEAMRNVRTGIAVGSPSPRTFKTLRMSDMKPNPGQGIYDFLNKICQRHGATIQPHTKRNVVVLTAPHYDQDPAFSIQRTNEPGGTAGNRITRALATRDYSSFPTFGLAVGKGVGKGGSTEDIRSEVPITEYIGSAPSGSEMRTIVNERAVAGRILPKDGRDPDGQVYRLLYMKDESSRNLEQLERANWRSIGERMKSSLVYEVTVQGHVDRVTGAIWTVDTICQVDDDLCNVHEPLWIQSRRLHQTSSQSEGRTTTLRMIRPYSILLEVA